ncbi:AraC-like DNA-binding protein [Variovorax boronicumulans]|jgi:AraC-like DNA-binding protein|uniref:AraC family transcriptional regulator n=1 Tax=Variovorax TaxID=34072 RepID=UPI00277FEAD8|nr:MULTISPECIES: AraC family transcriptional regulator [Variovorax]MDP9991733.1 AraC-like DNA-binding protein [Variovorax boronicumulans]MDQ0003761.1 AraC-like DNA-binding protein [Variovorax boronicumulans]MDQ0035282.1 AraC-like DNA-binding protein [Variovorax boronicumulans]MDQ0607323.1 AraC-like DNA-binding protein [Variovorax sp. W1I1]
MEAAQPARQEESGVLSNLARAVERIAQSDGDYLTAIPELSLHRRSATTEPMHCLYGFGVGITVSGQKRVALGEEVFDYSAGQSLLTTADLPVVTHITHASPTQPFMGLMLRLDPRTVVQAAAEMALPQPGKDSSYRAMSLGALDATLLGAVTRLVELIDEPRLLPQLAPLLQREILVRLLAGRHGPQLQRLVAVGSPSQQVVQSMAWLKVNFTQPVLADDLAASVHMSPSTFRQHFRAVAGMSPMQYLKQLRLQEARQLMLNQGIDAGTAGVRVGYESASQFSREYARLFGAPPLRDIRRMRETT